MFWLTSRPEQAISWSQAGGSLKADSVGVWWSSMPFDERIKYLSFVENQKLIEKDWDKEFGDRKNELVFIGQDMDEKLIRAQLDYCLSTKMKSTPRNGKKDSKIHGQFKELILLITKSVVQTAMIKFKAS